MKIPLSFRKLFSHDSWFPSLVMLFLAVFLLNFYFPLMTDEAYYMTWARRTTWPEWGFFDHPPFVSWQGVFTRYWNHILAARVGVIAASLVTFFVNVRIARLLFTNPRYIWSAAILAQSTIGAIANSFLYTPDSALMMWWTIALHESIVAIKVTPRRWLTAGLATGFGIISKYTMVLIGPVFLYGLIRDKNRSLRTPWPYLGGLVALLTIAPHLAWNAQHDWITFKFQFGHGLSLRQELTVQSTLPKAYEGGPAAPTKILYQELQERMSGVAGFAETKKKSKPAKSKWEQAWQYTGDFMGGVAGLWGVYALWWLAQVFRGKTQLKNRVEPSRSVNSSNEWHMIQASFWIPLVLFGLLSPFTKIEANWPAMHMTAGAMLLISNYLPAPRVIRSICMTHAMIALFLLFLGTHPEILPNARDNRLVVETAGYDQLATLVRETITDKKLAVDSYQLKSGLAARTPEFLTVQWPGITRPSEYTRGSSDDKLAEKVFLDSEGFSLLSFDDLPLELPNFTPIKLQGIRSCPDGSIGIYSVDHPILPCEKGLRDWWITNYKKIEPVTVLPQ